MLRRVARRADRLEAEAAQVDRLSIGKCGVPERQIRRARGDHGGADRSELPAAGDEVGVEMRLDGVCERESASLGELAIGSRIPCRIDDECPPVADVDDSRSRRRGVGEAPSPGWTSGSRMPGRPSEAGRVPATSTTST